MNSLTEEAQNAVGTRLYPVMEMQTSNDHPQIQSIIKQKLLAGKAWNINSKSSIRSLQTDYESISLTHDVTNKV